MKPSSQILRRSFSIVTSAALLGIVVGCGGSNSVNFQPSTVSQSSSTATASPCLREGIKLTLQVKPANKEASVAPELLGKMQEAMTKRLEGLGIKQAVVKPDESDRLSILLPSNIDVRQVERVLVTTAKLEFREQKPETYAQLSSEQQQLQLLLLEQEKLKKSGDPAAIAKNQDDIAQKRKAIATFFAPAGLTGANLTDANAQPSQIGNNWNLALKFDETGAKQFTEMTKNIAGTGRSIGIFIDDVLISSPTVGAIYAQTGITGGNAEISSKFTAKQAQEFAIQLRSGALPASVEIVSNQTFKNNNCSTSPTTSPQ
jgi:preprotein translocase subunit SecD